MSSTQEGQLNELVLEVIVDPEQEELVLEIDIRKAEHRPECELVHSQWERALEKIRQTLLEWNSEQSLDW